MTQSNVVDAIESGRESEEDVRSWLADATARFFDASRQRVFGFFVTAEAFRAPLMSVAYRPRSSRGRRASPGTVVAHGVRPRTPARGGAPCKHGLVRWADLERDAPRLAERARDRLVGPGVLLVATVRRDGTPRLSPVEPLLLDGDLCLSMLWQSRKAVDLLTDDRILVHSIVTGPDGDEGEIKVRGRAVPVDDPRLRLRYCDAVQSLGWRPVEPYFHLFVVDITDVSSVRYAKSGDQHVARWPERVEFVRRETSPTSVGEPEPATDLFRAE